MWPFGKGAESGKKKALVVDDDAVIRALIGDLLEAEGFEVLDAANGKDAVDIARARRPALIVMDINMPVMTGPQALDLIRHDPATKDIPVVIITAGQRGPAEQKAKAEGRPRLLFKPFNVNDLVSSVQEAMEGARS